MVMTIRHPERSEESSALLDWIDAFGIRGVILEQGKADAIGSIKQKIMDSIDSSNLQNDRKFVMLNEVNDPVLFLTGFFVTLFLRMTIFFTVIPASVPESPIPLALSSEIYIRSLV